MYNYGNSRSWTDWNNDFWYLACQIFICLDCICRWDMYWIVSNNSVQCAPCPMVNCGKVLFFIDLILIFLFRNAGVLDVEIFVGTDARVSKLLIGWHHKAALLVLAPVKIVLSYVVDLFWFCCLLILTIPWLFVPCSFRTDGPGVHVPAFQQSRSPCPCGRSQRWWSWGLLLGRTSGWCCSARKQPSLESQGWS